MVGGTEQHRRSRSLSLPPLSPLHNPVNLAVNDNDNSFSQPNEKSSLLPSGPPLTTTNVLSSPPSSPQRRFSSITLSPTRQKKGLRGLGRRLTGRFGRSSSSHKLHNEYGSVGSSSPSRQGKESTQQTPPKARGTSKPEPRNNNHASSETSNLPRTQPPTTSTSIATFAESTVVSRFETFLRVTFVLTIVFFAGTCLSMERGLAQTVLQYLAVAYGTCLMLWVAVQCERNRKRGGDETLSIFSEDEEDANVTRQLLAMEEGSNMEAAQQQQPRPTLLSLNSADEDDGMKHEGEQDEEATTTTRGEMVETSAISAGHERNLSEASSIVDHLSVPQQQQQPQTYLAHPCLNPLFITDALAGKRVNLNDPQHLHVMDTEYFNGHILILIRTSDVDDPTFSPHYPDNDQACQYFRGKQRRFEFQFQGKLKKLPTNRLYFACELDQSIKLGMIQRAFVGAAMAFVKSTNPFFHYSISGDMSTGEPPHMAFPFLEGMNRVVATPPHETAPVLGQGEIYESPASLKMRTKGRQDFEWNLQDTYTFALWSAYVDFLQWKCLNLPGIRPFGLSSVLGLQPIHMTVYEMDETADGNEKNNKGPHIRQEDCTLVKLELCQREITSLGPATKQAVANETAARISGHSGQTPLEIGTVVETTMSGDLESCDSGVEVSGANLAPIPLGTTISTIVEVDSDDESEEEEEVAAELGEGIYMRSGDSIIVREVSDSGSSITGDEASLASSSNGFVAMGGGFCLLQEQQPTGYTIKIQKVNQKPNQQKKRDQRRDSLTSSSGSLIKNGDTVLFKLLKADGSTLYLTIHRGWYLKWAPYLGTTKNGHFIIRNHQDFSQDDYDRDTIRYGGSFYLQHKRFSKFLVGAASEGSANFGGRLLGIYRRAKEDTPSVSKSISAGVPSESVTTTAPTPNSISRFDDDAWDENDEPDNSELGLSPTEWINPVRFRAFEGGTVPVNSEPFALPTSASEEKAGTASNPQLNFSSEDARMDAPLFIELMNRIDRVTHLAYAIRVVPTEEDRAAAFVRLRSGREIAEVLRVGQNWKSRRSSSFASRRRSQKTPQRDASNSSSEALNTSQFTTDLWEQSSPSSHMRQPSGESSYGAGEQEYEEINVYGETSDGENGFADELEEDGIPGDLSGNAPSSRKQRPRKFIGKFARSVKHRTTSAVVKVGKSTVSAGQSIVPIRPKNPPSREPNQRALARSKRRNERDFNVAANRGVKRMDRNDSNHFGPETSLVAGELSTPEKSCRAVSRMLLSMSSLPRSSEYHMAFNKLLNSLIDHTSNQDDSFLQGKAIDLGVSPIGESIAGCVVARCLWEGHWREEWCGLYERNINFYAPLSDKPSLELSFADIQSFRVLDIGSDSPLPGEPLLVIETAWQCYYIAFSDPYQRHQFHEKVEKAKNIFDATISNRESEKDLWRARFWQGFRSSLDASLSGGKGKWAEISFSNRKKRRVVLNNRRMVFDVPEFDASPTEFCGELLSKSLSFRFESLLEHPEEFGRFLDSTSQLQKLPFRDIDFMGPEAFCIFVNIYHCLLQHALLLTVNGPLTKRSCGHFFRTSCYEIGGDVFSLAELHICVIRGQMTKPVAPKPPFFDISKKSQAFQHYALGFSSPLVNFVLNVGHVSCPRQITIFTPDQFFEQLSSAAAMFVRMNVTVDEGKRLILIPRVCDVFRGDFPDSGSLQGCLKFCLQLLEGSMATKIQTMLQDSTPVTIKYQHLSDHYHSTLQAIVDEKKTSNIQDISGTDENQEMDS